MKKCTIDNSLCHLYICNTSFHCMPSAQALGAPICMLSEFRLTTNTLLRFEKDRIATRVHGCRHQPDSHRCLSRWQKGGKNAGLALCRLSSRWTSKLSSGFLNGIKIRDDSCFSSLLYSLFVVVLLVCTTSCTTCQGVDLVSGLEACFQQGSCVLVL